jgi:Family of unknown function (DUF5715)
MITQVKKTTKRVLIVFLLFAVTGVAVWAAFHFTRSRRLIQSAKESPKQPFVVSAEAWAAAVERVKEERREGGGGIEIPPELKHYSERYWFLATQVAEIDKHNVHTCQDFLDLAAMIERGEIVPVPAVTDSYVLFGVGERADESAFTRYVNEHNIDLYSEAEFHDADKRLDEKRSNLQSEITSLNSQLSKLTKRDRTKRDELQKQISARQQELSSIDEDKSSIDEFYGEPGNRQKLFREYESLQTLAKNFAGRSYNLQDPSDRHALKVNMLRSLRPVALKILEEVASAYHQQFNRPLHVSSLVRPEQYQRALRRVNRNAVLIDTPPHSTGLAFDIDYRYMSAAEQTFVMAQLARVKNEGRIEVIRERNANYHVFAFINGTRPGDDLITASLEKARPPEREAHHVAARKPAKVKQKPRSRTAKARPRSNVRKRRR